VEIGFFVNSFGDMVNSRPFIDLPVSRTLDSARMSYSMRATSHRETR
jgi:hypothetical protein